MTTKFTITNPALPHCGQTGVVKMVYYDTLRGHTGSSPDLLILAMADGALIRVLSTSGKEVSGNDQTVQPATGPEFPENPGQGLRQLQVPAQ